jgi:hypothetical protein
MSSNYSQPINPTNVTELNSKQVERLRSVLSQNVEIHGPKHFPTLEIILSDLIERVRQQLGDAGLIVKCVKLNGGAATHVFANEEFRDTDIDLIFPISFSNEGDFDDKVRNVVFDVLFSLMPIATTGKSSCADVIRDVYISKMEKVCTEEDRWSLFSLHTEKRIELKFVDRMRREFSVDSFQIILDPMLKNPKEVRPKVLDTRGENNQSLDDSDYHDEVTIEIKSELLPMILSKHLNEWTERYGQTCKCHIKKFLAETATIIISGPLSSLKSYEKEIKEATKAC